MSKVNERALRLEIVRGYGQEIGRDVKGQVRGLFVLKMSEVMAPNRWMLQGKPGRLVWQKKGQFFWHQSGVEEAGRGA
jgi:hypothetical protein